MKRIVVFLLTLLMLLSLAACGKETEESVIEAKPSAEDIEVLPEEAPAEDTPDAAVTVVYYHGDEQAEKLIKETAELNEGYEPQNIVELLISKGVLPEGIAVNAWGCDESGLMNIDFNSAFSEALQGMGTAGEYIMMGSLVNSLVENFELSGVVITAEGEAPATGHEIYDYVLNFYE